MRVDLSKYQQQQQQQHADSDDDDEVIYDDAIVIQEAVSNMRKGVAHDCNDDDEHDDGDVEELYTDAFSSR